MNMSAAKLLVQPFTRTDSGLCFLALSAICLELTVIDSSDQRLSVLNPGFQLFCSLNINPPCAGASEVTAVWRYINLLATVCVVGAVVYGIIQLAAGWTLLVRSR